MAINQPPTFGADPKFLVVLGLAAPALLNIFSIEISPVIYIVIAVYAYWLFDSLFVNKAEIESRRPRESLGAPPFLPTEKGEWGIDPVTGVPIPPKYYPPPPSQYKR